MKDIQIKSKNTKLFVHTIGWKDTLTRSFVSSMSAMMRESFHLNGAN